MPVNSVEERVYAPLMTDLEKRIERQVYPPGGQLPSESELRRSYSISRVSVRRALAELEGKGLVCRRAGKGTFVQFPGFDGRTPVLAPIGIGGPHSLGNHDAHLYLAPLRDAVAEKAFAMGYRVEWVNPRALGEIEKGALSGLVCVSWPDASLGDLHPIAERGVPVVAINRRPAPGPLHAVTIDHQRWAGRATEYLLHLGHREIAFVSGAWESAYIRERFAGYRQALEARGGCLDAELTLRLESSDPHDVAARIEALLTLRRPTALFIGAGIYAPPVLTALHRLGRAVPADISVVVFDDVPNPLYPIIPALTVVRQPLQELGHRSAALLDRLRRNGPSRGIVETVEAELVIRESCRLLS